MSEITNNDIQQQQSVPITQLTPAIPNIVMPPNQTASSRIITKEHPAIYWEKDTESADITIDNIHRTVQVDVNKSYIQDVAKEAVNKIIDNKISTTRQILEKKISNTANNLLFIDNKLYLAVNNTPISNPIAINIPDYQELTAGNNIQIADGVISSIDKDTKYKPGKSISISSDNSISVIPNIYKGDGYYIDITDDTIKFIGEIPDKLSQLLNDTGFVSADDVYSKQQIDLLFQQYENLIESSTSIITEEEKEIWNAKSDFSGSFNDLTDVPDIVIQEDLDEFKNHLNDEIQHITNEERLQWNAKSNFSGKYKDLIDKPIIPSAISQLTDDVGYLTEHQSLEDYAKKDALQDISDKVDTIDSTLYEAVDDLNNLHNYYHQAIPKLQADTHELQHLHEQQQEQIDSLISNDSTIRSEIDTNYALVQQQIGFLETNLEEKINKAQEDAQVAQNTADEVTDTTNLLIGDDSGKSIREIVEEEMIKQLIPEGADESLDTLEEIAQWIQNKADIENSISGKQDKLIAGNNITISDDNIISATGSGSVIIKDNTTVVDETLIFDEQYSGESSGEYNPGISISDLQSEKVTYNHVSLQDEQANVQTVKEALDELYYAQENLSLINEVYAGAKAAGFCGTARNLGEAIVYLLKNSHARPTAGEGISISEDMAISTTADLHE